MTAPRTISLTMPLKDEFLSDIIINASETAYSWFAFDLRARKWSEKATGKELTNNVALSAPRLDSCICIKAPLRYDRKEEDEGAMKGRHVLTLDSVAEGLRRIVSGECKCGMAGDIAQAVAEQDAGRLDANLCDLIVQAAIFNEVIYG